MTYMTVEDIVEDLKENGFPECKPAEWPEGFVKVMTSQGWLLVDATCLEAFYETHKEESNEDPQD